MKILILFVSFLPLSFAAAINEPVEKPKSFKKKIVGGEAVDIEDFPYHVSVQLNGRHFCGGVILSNLTCLTAAHCTDGINVNYLSIRAGSSLHAEKGQVIGVKEIVQHHAYNRNLIDFDLSILQLQSPLIFGDKVEAIPIAAREPQLGVEAFVSGWGSLWSGGPITSQLQAVMVPIIPAATCSDFYPRQITTRMICAGHSDGGRDACQGDSGGPIVIQTDKGVALVGCVSWGRSCALPQYPGVYANAVQMRSWINQNMV